MLESIGNWLQFGGAATGIWVVLVGAAASYLVGLGLAVLIKRDIALRYLGVFASTPRANAIECSLRIVAGIALLGAAQRMMFTDFHRLFGAILVVTSIAMLMVYEWHKRYASWAVPFAQRIAPLFGVLALALGGFVGFCLVH